MKRDGLVNYFASRPKLVDVCADTLSNASSFGLILSNYLGHLLF